MMKPAPEPFIADLLDPSRHKDGIGLSTITVFGIINGMGRLPPGNQGSRLLPSFEGVLKDYFADRILPWTMEEAHACARIMERRRRAGVSPDAYPDDAIPAAAALSRKLTVAARNESALRHTGADILNPWSPRAT
jgi:predicted nucleic acid-binding protein